MPAVLVLLANQGKMVGKAGWLEDIGIGVG